MAVGRKTVAPRQTITSQWGNWTWDQSVQSFATLADRSTQFPAPQRGACCTVDAMPGLLFQWNGTAWMTTQVGRVTPTTNGFGTAVIPMPYPFKTGFHPAYVITAEAVNPPYDWIATVDFTNSSHQQLACAVWAFGSHAVAANAGVPLSYYAYGEM